MPNSIDGFVPSPPPSPVRRLPSDPFEAWLARQEMIGHDRYWLNRNIRALRARWQSNPDADLPLPIEPLKVAADRRDEL